MRIAIVNDMPMAVEVLRRVLSTVPDYQIAWIARDGAEAVEKCKKDVPDLILMDLIMPVMDGVESSRRIMKESPCAILIVTFSVGVNASKVFEAMGCGALDAVRTPSFDQQGGSLGGEALIRKIQIIGRLIGKAAPVSKLVRHHPSVMKVKGVEVPHLLVIGSSTGGPTALVTILRGIPRGSPIAIVIVQHVDLQFSHGLAAWLKDQTGWNVQVAKDGASINAGEVVLAGTDNHLVVNPNLTLKYVEEPKDSSYRPSVDVFFKSIAKYWPHESVDGRVALLLTGMGRDGAEGLGVLKAQGWHTIAQNEESCVVYGMPKAAVEMNAVDEILHLDSIAKAVCKRIL